MNHDTLRNDPRTISEIRGVTAPPPEELVKKLRGHARRNPLSAPSYVSEAADEIERLQQRLADADRELKGLRRFRDTTVLRGARAAMDEEAGKE